MAGARISFLGKSKTPLKLPLGSTHLFLATLEQDRVISPQDRYRTLQPLSVYGKEVTPEVLESCSPSGTHLTFRWLRNFFTGEEPQTSEISATPLLPHSSLFAALMVATQQERSVLVELPKGSTNSLLSVIDRVARTIPVGIEVAEVETSGIPIPTHAPRATKMLEVAFGERASYVWDLLNEVFESGGSVSGRVLLDLLGEEVKLLKPLVAFDFLRVRGSSGGAIFTLTLKGLECVLD